MNKYIYDCEGDGLLDTLTKLHCIIFKVHQEDKWLALVDEANVSRGKLWADSQVESITVADYTNIKRIREGVVVCHNQYGYDIEAIKRTVGYDLEQHNMVLDTLVLSRYYNPTRFKHGLESWGQQLANKKPEVSDWSTQPIEVYLHRCLEDVKITELTFDYLADKLADPKVKAGYPLADIVYRDICKQERDGVVFDQDKANDNLRLIEDEMAAISKRVEPQLGTFTLPKSKQPTWPAKPFKKDGSLSASGINYGKKFGITDEDELRKMFKGGQPLVLTGDIKLENQDAVKKFLFTELGWKPTIWRVKDITRDERKQEHPIEVQHWKARAYAQDMYESVYKPYLYTELELPKKYRVAPSKLSDQDMDRLIDFIVKKGRGLPTTPQYADPQSKALCINLEEHDGELARGIVRWLSLRNRKGVIAGWLGNSRLAIDGRLGAGVSGLANTHRQRHHTVVNVPKADPTVVFGKEMRELFIPPEGMVCVGCDAAALEARVAGHFTYEYDGGEYAKELLEGDSHSKNAEAYTSAAGKEITRSRGKNITYGTLYGAQGARIGKMLEIPKDKGQAVVDAFWASNPGLLGYKTDLENQWHLNGQTYVEGLDGRRIITRSKHSLVNASFQSAGAIIMDRAWAIARERLDFTQCQRWGYFHDEYQMYATPEYADECGQIIADGIIAAGEFYNFNIPLDAEYDIGINWAETH